MSTEDQKSPNQGVSLPPISFLSNNSPHQLQLPSQSPTQIPSITQSNSQSPPQRKLPILESPNASTKSAGTSLSPPTKKLKHDYQFVQYQNQSSPPQNFTPPSTTVTNEEKEEKHIHYHQNHHRHRHHHHPVRPHHHHHIVKKFIKKPPPKLNLDPIFELIEEFHPKRQFLGTIIYNPTTTWETLQISQLYGVNSKFQHDLNHIKQQYIKRKQSSNFLESNYIPMIPPLTPEYINCIIEVKIPFRYIIDFKNDVRNQILKRELWGGASAMYTDDSNILEILLHMGFFDNKLNLNNFNKGWKVEDIIKPTVSKEIDEDSLEYGVFGDLSVEILLLPTLPKYYGYFANGINSRNWIHESVHNGLSIAIYNVKWETRNSYLNDRSLFKIYQQELNEDFKLTNQENALKQGWKFDMKIYKKIKEKYEKEDKEKKEEQKKDEQKKDEKKKS
ncbi:unnamed protein product [Candida verbasci]|uniref:Rxt3-domain-containing protein n=1 Tax=Candida verbasci TaxID=1227364 RepID=A0A9W4TUI2_9ASCO|nr:unnamed protein product [Candida verbasci]